MYVEMNLKSGNSVVPVLVYIHGGVIKLFHLSVF